MKTIMLIIFISFAFVPAIAQQPHFKWKGTLNLDQPTDIFLDFRNDTCEAIRVADSQSLETMHYTLSDTLLTLQKITGGSECDSTSVGKYKIEKKDNGMLVTLISDDCDDRSHVLDNTMWTKEQ
jgi:hypothetical protein